MAHDAFLGEEALGDRISVLVKSGAFRLAACGKAVISGVDDGVVGQLYGIDVTFVGITHLAPYCTLDGNWLTVDVFSGRNFQSVNLLGKAKGETLLQRTREAGDAVPLAILKGLSIRGTEFDAAIFLLGAEFRDGCRDIAIGLAVVVKSYKHLPGNFFTAVGKEDHLFHALLPDGEFHTAAEVVESECLKGFLGSMDHGMGAGDESCPVKSACSGRLYIWDGRFHVAVPLHPSCRLIGIHCPEIIPALYPSVGVVAHAAGKIGCLGRGAEGRGEFFLVQEVHFDGVAVFPEDGAILLKDGFGGIAFTGGTDGKEGGFLLHGYFLAGTGCKGKKCRKNIYSLFHGFQSLMVTSNLLHRFLRCRRRQALP